MDKSEFKALIINELGAKIEDMAEVVKLDTAKYEGAKEALILANKKINELQIIVDKDLDNGDLNNLQDPINIAKYIKKYLIRASAILENGTLMAEKNYILSQGKSQALQKVIINMQKTRDIELEKSNNKKNLEQNLETQQNIIEPVGIHPGTSIKAQRKTEGKENA
jgi:hypothetical protein